MSKIKNYDNIKNLVYKLDEGKCHICRYKVSYKAAVLDHIIPRAVSGRDHTRAPDEYWNLRLAHKGCNSKRSNARIPGQLRLHIKEI